MFAYWMMLAGIFIGAIYAGFGGAFWGGCLGFLTGYVFKLGARVSALEKHLQTASSTSDTASETSSAQAVAAAQLTEITLSVSEPEPTMSIAEPIVRSHCVEPSAFDKTMRFIKRYFTVGNVPVRVGMLILLVGTGFLLQYSFERDLFPIEYRLMLTASTAIALLVMGWRLRTKRLTYALVMQGGAVGVLYLTLFAAFRFYTLLPSLLVFPLLIALAIFSGLLAVLQNSRALAVLGISGGFLAPVLTSTGDGSHVALFSYYTILNLGILGVAWFKSWRLLNLVGFVFTFVIGTAWGLARYRPEWLLSTECFLILFFLFYVLLSILFAWRQPPQLKGYVDGTLVFGTPLLGFALQSGLMDRYEYGMAWSAFCLGFFYLGMAMLLQRVFAEKLRSLGEVHLALGVVFASLAIPMAFDGNLTAAFWSLEGAAMLWLALRQQRTLGKLFALLLLVGAGLLFWADWQQAAAARPLLNSAFLGAFLLSVAGGLSAYLLYRHYAAEPESWELQVSFLLLVWGLAWWLGNGLGEIARFVPQSAQLASSNVFIALSAALVAYLSRCLRWPVLRYTPTVHLAAMLIIYALALAWQAHPAVHGGWLAWLLALLIFYGTLYYLPAVENKPRLLALLHAGGLWLGVALVSWEAIWQTQHWIGARGVWYWLAWALPAWLGLAVILHLRLWPWKYDELRYKTLAARPLVFYLVMWSLLVNRFSDGDAWPSIYIPFLNPLDCMQILIFLLLLQWWLICRRAQADIGLKVRNVYVGAGIGVFYWLNAVLLRSLHHAFDIEFRGAVMWKSYLVQASFSIFWTILGMLLMIVATRKAQRKLWMAGGALIAVVVAKLFLIDLSGSQGVERIVSFLAVGVLLLVLGYFSPLPPAHKGKSE